MSSTDERLTGQVKWFNNRTGYGFITLVDGEHKDKDIFTHFSAIQVSDSQYKFLVQGEYVELGLSKPDSGNHEFQATNVTGVKGGKIMCEMRTQTRPDTSSRPTRDNKRSKDIDHSDSIDLGQSQEF